jgi:hypothetical protein
MVQEVRPDIWGMDSGIRTAGTVNPEDLNSNLAKRIPVSRFQFAISSFHFPISSFYF